jgi:hypothetical protein
MCGGDVDGNCGFAVAGEVELLSTVARRPASWRAVQICDSLF